MAFRGTIVGSVLLVLMTVLWSRSMAQSGCTNTLIGMAPCLNYVTGRSSTPTSSCCSSLANVVKSQPQCLCSALNGGRVAALGITINSTLALALPGACNVKTPPVSLCNGTNGPVVSPVGFPGNSPSVSGSKTTQENGATPSGGSIITTPFLLVAILVIMASYV